MDIIIVFTEMAHTSGGGESFFNIGLLSLFFFVLGLANASVSMTTSRGPTRDSSLNLAFKIIPAIFIGALGALAALIAHLELFDGYAQFYAMSVIFDMSDGMATMTYQGTTMFAEVLGICAVYGLLILFHVFVARRSVESLAPQGRWQAVRRTVLPDLALLGTAAVFSLLMCARPLMFRVTLDYSLGNYLYSLYFYTVFLIALRVVMLPLYTLIMVPGCWKGGERALRGDTPYQRFVQRIRRGAGGKALLGVICLLLMAFVLSVLFQDAGVRSGEQAVAEGIQRYTDKVLRFDDVNVIYEKRGYLTTAQGSPAEDLYIAEIEQGVYLAVYVDATNERQLELGTGNTVIGQVQGYRSFPEKKFLEVAEALGIDAESATLVYHPVKYKLSRAAYGTYMMAAILSAIPLLLLGLAAARFINPLGGRAVRQFIRRNCRWQELLGQLETELEDEKKIICRGTGLSAGYYVTENFLFCETVGAVRILHFPEVKHIASVDYGKYGSCVMAFQLKNGLKITWHLTRGMEMPIRGRLEWRP